MALVMVQGHVLDTLLTPLARAEPLYVFQQMFHGSTAPGFLFASGFVAGLPRAPLSARAAYLLAFHHAQDALDVYRMLLIADRLDQAGEDHLAARLRAMTRHVALNDPVPPLPTTPGPHTLHNPQYLVDKPTSQALPSGPGGSR